MQSSYTAQLTITAQTAWDTWYAFSDRACNDTATAYRWYVNTFFSEAASRRYEWIGQMIATLGYLAFLYGKQARTRYEAFLDAQVAEVPSVAELMPEAAPATEPATQPVAAEPTEVADPFSPALNPHYPVDYSILTSAQLRQLCSQRGIKWRNAHGKKHLPKAAMIEALAAA